ncbi:thioredoxin domain-containing protein 15 [Drosophila ficusphila]|uniref:thioredoxin domain-containing protein 15 n=1 Tax=Drosophila ficusphila TaxID=30025 RepID=UPI0007E71E1D|nr:thioredoxin domain-containing protein 15 [Drosophila ficusphila]
MQPNLLFIFLLFATQAQAELSGLLSALHYFGLYSNGTSDLGISKGQCHYSFETFALLEERRTCSPDDKYILHLTQLPPVRKPPILIKCLQQEPPENNGSAPEPGLLIMRSAKEIVSLLKPIGNATKRHEPGSCVVVHFCTASSLECARVAPLINLLPHLFPTLPIAYVDAYEFGRFNAEFGIVSLPTLMIFHQGRPLIKYDPWGTDSEKRSFGWFIMRHTNVKPVDPQVTIDPKNVYPYLSNVPLVETDYYLGLAWAFILACLANYLRQTVFWKQLVEMVQRNWRESEETQMEMVD